jgi:flagellin
MRAANQQNAAHSGLSRALDHVATGLRITRAADDAAGSAISIELSAQIHSNQQAIRNANDGISMSHISQASVTTARDLLDRGRELAVQSASDTMTEDERSIIDDEWVTIVDEMKRLALVTDFNGQTVSNGEEYDVQVGTGNTRNDRITLSMGSVRALVIAVGVVDLSTDSETSQKAIDSIDKGIDAANSQLAILGAQENRVMSSIRYAISHGEALSQSKSRITDADMAASTTQMTAFQIKSQASVSALSQAGQLSSGVIGLISS